MVGIVLITHGFLGQTLIDCAKHVIGDPLKNITAVGINGSGSIEAMTEKAAEAISNVDDGSGIIVLTDMYGGSPSNITKKLLESDNVYGISGVNLPMLIRVLTYQDRDIKTLIKKGLSGGSEGVMQIPLK
ncbi:MAG: PTS fructose transporter subunit IIA [Burkholderiales bacterium]|nr:PTS fructose transporter subunit IIA [Burkholderiales bacterium]OUT80029.1 MAG: PTS fructose transporter subunit IIA [Betaproteobacteria bacterium TMED22]|tara:strand:- start:7222 stop:7611 length:390 start_codon:yes stop_codon:yes gene_type:complete